MSELTRCNYCSLQWYKREARRQHQKVTLMVGTKYKSLPSGVEVYVHLRWLDEQEAK
jgi:hypothetical protein